MTFGTIPEKFIQIAEKFPNKTALMFKKKGKYKSITFAQLLESVTVACSALKEMGICKGDKVAIMSEGRPEWVIVDLAAMCLGAIIVPIHTTLSAKIINYVICHSEAKIIFASKTEYLNKISQDESICLENFVLMDDFVDGEVKINKIISWDDFIEKGKNKKFTLEKINAEETCTIIYTSGTTGLPKGVMLSNKNILSDIKMITESIPAFPSDVFLSFLPLSHVLERTAGYYIPLLTGATIAYAENSKTLPANLLEVKPTILICVPRIFEKFNDAIWNNVLYSTPFSRKIFYWALKRKKGLGYFLADKIVFSKVRKKMGGRLRLAISGGASLDERIGKFFNKIGINILEGYGLTETAPVLSANRLDNLKFGTVGLPLNGLEIRISVDKEILVKGPNVMIGYYKNNLESREVIDEDGWFHTGDYGFIDSDGFLIVIGRKKDMIITSGGKNIWPEHIETELNFDKLISQSIIIGHKRKFVSALIVPDCKELNLLLKSKNLPEKKVDEICYDDSIIKIYHECIGKINGNLSEYEQIKKFHLIDREFSQEMDEITPTLKIRRHAVENHFKKEIEEMYL